MCGATAAKRVTSVAKQLNAKGATLQKQAAPSARPEINLNRLG